MGINILTIIFMSVGVVMIVIGLILVRDEISKLRQDYEKRG